MLYSSQVHAGACLLLVGGLLLTGGRHALNQKLQGWRCHELGQLVRAAKDLA